MSSSKVFWTFIKSSLSLSYIEFNINLERWFNFELYQSVLSLYSL